MDTKDRLCVGRGHQIDDWIRAGGIIVASSERAARSIRSAFNRRRLADGFTAWPTPRIFEWKTFIRQQWDLLPSNGNMVMSILQEEWLPAHQRRASTTEPRRTTTSDIPPPAGSGIPVRFMS